MKLNAASGSLTPQIPNLFQHSVSIQEKIFEVLKLFGVGPRFLNEAGQSLTRRNLRSPHRGGCPCLKPTPCLCRQQIQSRLCRRRLRATTFDSNSEHVQSNEGEFVLNREESNRRHERIANRSQFAIAHFAWQTKPGLPCILGFAVRHPRSSRRWLPDHGAQTE